MRDIRSIEQELDRGLCRVLLYVPVITNVGVTWMYQEVGSARLPEHLHTDYDPIWVALCALMPWWPDNKGAMVPGFVGELVLLPPRIKKIQDLKELEKVCA